MARHDFYCPRCDSEQYDVYVTDAMVCARLFPACQNCGTGTRISWARGLAPSTDVLGVEKYSDALGGTYTSQRDLDQKMKAAGFEPCGDKVGGARNESHLNLGKKFSFGSAQKSASRSSAT